MTDITDIKALIKSGERNNGVSLVKFRLNRLGFPVKDDGYADQATLDAMAAVHKALDKPFQPENVDCYALCGLMDQNAKLLEQTAHSFSKPAPVTPPPLASAPPPPAQAAPTTSAEPKPIENKPPVSKKDSPPPPPPAPAPVNNDKRDDDHHHSFGSVTKDIFVDAPVAAAKGTAKGVAFVGKETGKGVAYAVTHPIKTITTPFKKLFGLFGGGDDDDRHKLSASELTQARNNPAYQLFKENPGISGAHFAPRDAIAAALDPGFQQTAPLSGNDQSTLKNHQLALKQKLIQAGYLSIHDVQNGTDAAPMHDALQFIADKFKLNGRTIQETAAKMEVFFSHIDSPKKLDKALHDAAKHPEKTVGYIHFNPIKLKTEHNAYLAAWDDSFRPPARTVFADANTGWGGALKTAAQTTSTGYDQILANVNLPVRNLISDDTKEITKSSTHTTNGGQKSNQLG